VSRGAGAQSTPSGDEPGGATSSLAESASLPAETTRVATLKLGRDTSNRVFPESGTTTPFHSASHHQDVPANIANYAKIGRYHVSKMAYFAKKLQSIPDGDGTLLDHSLILYGTNMGNSNQHQHYDVPHVLVGGAGGQHKGGRQIAFDRKTWRTGSLLLSVLDMYGIHNETQGDSNVPDWPYSGRLAKL